MHTRAYFAMLLLSLLTTPPATSVAMGAATFELTDVSCKLMFSGSNGPPIVLSREGSLSRGTCVQSERRVLCNFSSLEEGVTMHGGQRTAGTAYVVFLQNEVVTSLTTEGGNYPGQLTMFHNESRFVSTGVYFEPVKNDTTVHMIQKMCAGALRQTSPR